MLRRLFPKLTPALAAAALLAPIAASAVEVPADPFAVPVVPIQVVLGIAPAPAPAPTVNAAAAPKSESVILDAVSRARGILQGIVDARNAASPQPYRVPNGNSANITLAVWDKVSGEILLVEAVKSGTDLTFTSGPKLPITVEYSGKLYSRYDMPADSNKMVVGVIYPVLTKKVVNKATIYEATDTVYVPYDAAYYRPEVLADGSNYLSFLIQEAYDELRAMGIKSRAFPDKLLVDVVDPYLVKSIAVIEQTDHATLLGDEGPERGVGRFLVKLATNRESAFGAAISTAGAAGMVQFIPSTYALMVSKRPDLGLIPDFRAGMADHKNAVKAQVAYLDMDLANIATARSMYGTDVVRSGEYLAAAYNGGSARVKKAIIAYGDGWFNYKKGSASSLRLETATYVAKLKAVYAMFTAGYFATPAAPNGALPDQSIAIAPQVTTPVTQTLSSELAP